MDTSTVDRKKILLVEDDQLIARAYRFALGEAGFDVIVADDGKMALDMVKKEKVHLILLDVIMPGLNGFEVLEKIKKKDDCPPVIMISNLGQSADISHAKKLGAIDFLIKSNLSLKEMVDIVKKQLA